MDKIIETHADAWEVYIITGRIECKKLYNSLFWHFLCNEEMPHAVATQTGGAVDENGNPYPDPYEWLEKKLSGYRT